MDKKAIAPLRLRITNLSYSSGATQILRDINLALSSGSALAVIGASGSGKTSLLRCISLFNSATTGKIELDEQVYFENGNAIFSPWEVRRRIVLVTQNYALLPNLTGLENITLGLRSVLRSDKCVAEERARFLAGEFGLSEGLLNRYPDSFSGGQAQRVAIVRALAVMPKVLLLDEVTSALDPETISNVVDAIRRIRREREYDDLSVVLVTHLMQFAREFSDEIVFMHEGSILRKAPSDEFFSRIEDDAISRFLANVRLPY